MSRESEARPCGECAMCCKLFRIDKATDGGEEDFPFNKPAGVMCQYFKPGVGCTIHGTEQFPTLCKTYQCLWKTEPFSPEEARPDKVRVIFEAVSELPEFPGHPVVLVEADPSRKPNARVMTWIEKKVDAGWAFVMNVLNRRVIITDVPGMLEALTEREKAYISEDMEKVKQLGGRI